MGVIILFFGVGFLLKFARQTRITGDLAFGSWTQNAQFLPYTINSVILTPAGTPANSVASLQASSLNGKIDTTNVNVGFVSRPVTGLGIRLRYRNYDLTNKTTPIVWTGTVGALRIALEPMRDGYEAWPRSDKGLSDALRRPLPR